MPYPISQGVIMLYYSLRLSEMSSNKIHLKRLLWSRTPFRFLDGPKWITSFPFMFHHKEEDAEARDSLAHIV